jgi:uncharacterized protein (TIGR03000 family)
LGLGYYGGYYGYPGYYGAYPGYYGYYGNYGPSYGDYYGTGDYYGAYQPYGGTDMGAYAPEAYGSTYGYYEPNGAPGSAVPAITNAARIVVRVPPEAQVWFEGAPTKQPGSTREFESPPLAPGKEFTYEVRAQWREGDHDVTQTRKIDVHAGDRVTVDFTKTSRGTAPTQAPTSSPPPRPSGS